MIARLTEYYNRFNGNDCMNWHHILFAVDSSGHVGPRVLRKLVQLARALDAEVELFQCAFEWGAVRKGGIGSIVSDQEMGELAEGRRDELEDVAQALRNGGLRTRTTVSCERPGYENILRQVQASKPHLVVAHSARHSSLARWVLTHSDFKLIETCPCPLLLLKTEKAYLDPCVVAAVDPMHAHDKPAALDERIVEAASLMANALGGTLHLFHARAPWPKPLEASAAAESRSEPTYAEPSAAYRERTELRIGELARKAQIPAHRIHISWGDAAEQLPQVARSLNADVVVMGADSRSGLQRVFLGHTAERVLDALDCDVLVVKPPSFHSVVGDLAGSAHP
jgi:universal stress protein E